MRITGGKYLRRNIVCPPGIIRPAMDRMRESLFSILGSLEGDTFLDLFSGSGCVAIEAASRGAKRVHLVELDKGKKSVIDKNLSFVEEENKLFLMDVYRYIATCVTKYDVIYADPPFNMENKVNIAVKVSECRLLKDKGLFIVHYPEEDDKLWPEEIGDLKEIDFRRYGRSHVKFYQKGAK